MNSSKYATRLKANASAKVRRLKTAQACSPWLANFSNRALPPFFFLFIGILSLLLASQTSSELTRLNLSLLSVFSGATGFYFLGS